MNDVKTKFIELIKRRSCENKMALETLFEKGLFGKCISTLREELDSFIRIMYLGRLSDTEERKRLMVLTLEGKIWKVLTYIPNIFDKISNNLSCYFEQIQNEEMIKI